MPVADQHPGRLPVGSRRVLVTLCGTQVTSWGVLYYAFPVLSIAISADTGWSASSLAAAFSAALAASAVVGVWVGRWVDRHGPRGVMTVGSLLGAFAVLGIATTPTFAGFVSAWLVAGVAMSAVLYPPAFAALTRWYGPRGVRALTVVTLVGGLASTVFAPITAALEDRVGWRGAYLVLAAILVVVTVFGHWFGLSPPWPAPAPQDQQDRPESVLRSRPFLALAAALSLAAVAGYAVVVNLVPLLVERGMSLAAAAAVLGAGGAGQVLGRLGYPTIARRLDVRARTVAVLVAVGVTTAFLGVLTSPAALVTAAIVAGAVRGNLTLLQATAVTDRWGSAAYGHLTGVLSVPVSLVAALAPWIGAATATALGGYPTMFLAMAAVGAAAAAAGSASIPKRMPTTKRRRTAECR